MTRRLGGLLRRILLGWMGDNLYQYAENPINWVDPFGLSPEDLVRYKPQASITPNPGARGTAINRAWGQERELVKQGGGSRNGAPPRDRLYWRLRVMLSSLLRCGKRDILVTILTVWKGTGARKAWKGDPRNIVFLQNANHPSGIDEHLKSPQGHRGNYGNSGRGRLIDRLRSIPKGSCG